MTAFRWNEYQLCEALGLPAPTLGAEIHFDRIVTDTRSLRGGDLFVALVGERFDGHAFLDAAADQGALGAVVSRDLATPHPRLRLFSVPDSLTALGQLAHYRRMAHPGKVVGVTGSSGKTSVKELLTASLGSRYPVHATHGNENNRVGVPLTLLGAPEDAAFIVVEMGTSELGEILELTRIAEPDAAIVTTVSEAHVEGLGSLEGVLTEKLDLLRGARVGAPLLVGDDPALLATAARAIRPEVHVAGLSDRADPPFRAALGRLDPEGHYEVEFRGARVRAPLPGRHGAQNLVLALAMAELLGVTPEGAIPAASAVGVGKFRGEWRSIGSIRALLDCYNANPQSMRGALHLLVEISTPGPRVAVLGSMLELGARSEVLHREVLREALELPIDLILATGEFAEAGGALEHRASVQGRLLLAEDPVAGYPLLRRHLTGGETLLLKGSRGVAMERLIPLLEGDFATGRGRGASGGAG